LLSDPMVYRKLHAWFALTAGRTVGAPRLRERRSRAAAAETMDA
jgi:hypothetical protein